MAIGSNKVFNFQMSRLDIKIINEKLDESFNTVDFIEKVNIARGFVFKMSKREIIGNFMRRKLLLYSKNRLYCVQKQESKCLIS